MIRNVVKLGLLVGLIALIGVALFRPATLFGVDGKALGSSVGDEVAQTTAKCSKRSGFWQCEVTGGNAVGADYAVRTHRFGCWTGTRVAAPAAAAEAKISVSGCIRLTDIFGQ